MVSEFTADVEISQAFSNQESVDILFTGDFYLGHDFWKENPVSEPLKEQIRTAEYAVTNLEGAIDAGEPIVKQGPNLSIPGSTIETVRNSGFDAVSLANNHAMDFGGEGLAKTQDAVREAGMESFGAGPNLQTAIAPVTVDCGDTTVGIFGLSENQEETAGENSAGIAWAYEPNIGLKLQKRIEECDVSVLVAHGGIEYVPIPPRSWRAFLRSCTDLGFDLILGHHPHTPQGWESYQGTPIFYSLGNFAMYRPDRPSTQWGYLVKAQLDDRHLTGVRVSLTEVSDGQVRTSKSPGHGSYRAYLANSSRIVAANDDYKPHWQTVAVKLFEELYDRQLSRYGLGRVTALFNDPVRELDQLTRACAGLPGQDIDRAMKEYIQNPSHRCTMQTALALKTSAERDKRTAVAEKTIRQMFQRIDDEQTDVQKNLWRLRIVARRILDAVTD